MTYSLRFLTAAALILLTSPLPAAWFLPLPQLPGATQPGDAFALSADGSTVVGTSHDGSTFQAVRWTSDGAISSLAAGDSSSAWGVSGDGSVIAGYRIGDRGHPVAFRWTQSTGSVDLGDFPGGELSSIARDVSLDGNVVVGIGSPAEGGEAFRWTSAAGMSGLGDLPGGSLSSEAFGVSADGSVIVGSSVSANGIEAFRWTTNDGMLGLGDLPGGGFFSEAYGVSADGSVIVGRSAGAAGLFPYRAFRWTVGGGMVMLPDVPGIGPTETAEAVSGDGNVIIGAAYFGDSVAAFAWDSFHGSRSISALLAAQGVDMDGFELRTARAVSGDGLTMAGLGVRLDDRTFQTWVARLDEGTFVPEPSSIVLWTIAGIGFYLYARRTQVRLRQR